MYNNKNFGNSGISNTIRKEYVGLLLPLVSYFLATSALFLKDGKFGKLRPQLIKSIKQDASLMASLKLAGVPNLSNLDLKAIIQLSELTKNEVNRNNRMLITLNNVDNNTRAAGNWTRRLREGEPNFENNFNASNSNAYEPYKTPGALRKLRSDSNKRRAAFFNYADSAIRVITYIVILMHSITHMLLVLSDVPNMRTFSVEELNSVTYAIYQYINILNRSLPAMSGLLFSRLVEYIENRLGLKMPTAISLAVPAGFSYFMKKGITQQYIDQMLVGIDSLSVISDRLATHMRSKQVKSIIISTSSGRRIVDALQKAGDSVFIETREALMSMSGYVIGVLVAAGVAETASLYRRMPQNKIANNNNNSNGNNNNVRTIRNSSVMTRSMTRI
tara:strand:+ start:2211 stop:3377 length:1167 start_codon:yes stop_codon:yes gene_type:complete